MEKGEARLRCAVSVAARGGYQGSAERLRQHFTDKHSRAEDVEIVRRECGADCYHGGNFAKGWCENELLAIGWGEDCGKICYDYRPKSCEIGTLKDKERFTWAQIAAGIRAMYEQDIDIEREQKTMSNAITTGTTTAMQPAHRLQEIEFEIQYHVRRAAGHLLDVGRCLNAAKDEGLVPHGQWEDWVERNAGINVRTAQRIMSAAREVSSDSPLARLEFSKVRALLALPAAEREDFAETNDAEHMSVRELEAAIKAKKEAELAAQRAAKELEALKGDIPKLAEHMAGEMAESMAAELIDEYKETMDKEHSALLARLAEAQAAASDAGYDTQAKIDAMQAELDAQEAEIERQAKLRADAQAELLRARSQAARGETGEAASEKFTADDLGAAARLFIGRAAVLPHMAGQLATMTENERAAYRQYVDMLADWCESSRAALNTIEAGEIDG